jgi:predicted DCC family thiol-disulfide oxidoreductase YuxK
MIGMSSGEAQRSSAGNGPHLVLYDGVCALCNGFTRFVLARDRQAFFHFASLQSAVGTKLIARLGARPQDLTTIYVVENYTGATPRAFTKSRAVLFIAGRLGWPSKAATLLGALPTFLLDTVYDLVARYRYQVFGRYDQCPLPPPDRRSRFVDFTADGEPE